MISAIGGFLVGCFITNLLWQRLLFKEKDKIIEQMVYVPAPEEKPEAVDSRRVH